MPDRSIWEGAPDDLDRRIRIARTLLDLADQWDLAGDLDASEPLRRAAAELRDVVRREVL